MIDKNGSILFKLLNKIISGIEYSLNKFYKLAYVADINQKWRNSGHRMYYFLIVNEFFSQITKLNFTIRIFKSQFI